MNIISRKKKRRAIVHIGTEKTGSTSIQSSLHDNSTENESNGYLYPFKPCGLISNYRLVLYTLENPVDAFVNWEKRSFKNEVSQNIENNYSQWKTAFASDHVKTIRNFQDKRKNSVVIYSSEHFHSRVHRLEEISFLKMHLDEIYDEIDIIFYMRRQDHLALSAHNSSIQAGNVNWFDFSRLPRQGLYYDYLALAERWASVFGDERVTPRIYESDRLLNGDVVSDFNSFVNAIHRRSPHDSRGHLVEPVKSAPSKNTRLSFTALRTLMAFNKLDEEDPVLGGKSKQSLRQPLIAELHHVNDDHGVILPARSEAEEFYANYADGNDILADKWLGGKGFSRDFSTYPEKQVEIPIINEKPVLIDVLNRLS